VTLNIKATEARLVLQSSTGGARFDMVDTGGTTDAKWMQLITDGGLTKFRSVEDDGASLVTDNILSMNLADGRVGIGVASAITNLQVKGASLWRGQIIADTTGTSMYSGFGWYEAGTRKWSIYNHYTLDTLMIADDGGTDMVAFTQTGKVGIGVTNPTAKLQVETSANGLNIIGGFKNDNGTEGGNAVGFGFLNESNGDWWKAAIVHERMAGYGIGSLHFLVDGSLDNGTVTLSANKRMSILYNGDITFGTTGVSTTSELWFDNLAGNSTLHVSGNIIANSSTISSDRRLKKNIEYLSPEASLDVVMALRPATFNKIKKGNAFYSGFIAQDVEEVLPHLISEQEMLGMKEGVRYKALNESGMISYLVGSIQKLKKEIEHLKLNN
jgi:hypothetical protein